MPVPPNVWAILVSCGMIGALLGWQHGESLRIHSRAPLRSWALPPEVAERWREAAERQIGRWCLGIALLACAVLVLSLRLRPEAMFPMSVLAAAPAYAALYFRRRAMDVTPSDAPLQLAMWRLVHPCLTIDVRGAEVSASSAGSLLVVSSRGPWGVVFRRRADVGDPDLASEVAEAVNRVIAEPLGRQSA